MLSPNKSHDCNSLSTGMIKLCCQSIAYRLKNFFKLFSKSSTSRIPEKTNIGLVYKKESKFPFLKTVA